MPPSERRDKILNIMRWLDARAKNNRHPKPLEAKRFIELEICEMGSTPRTIQKYLQRLQVLGLVNLEAGKLKVTKKGKTWLSLHTQ